MQTKRTDPAPKYGPTAVYGSCESDECEANARATCARCDGHFCLRHADHAKHEAEHPVSTHR